MEIGRASRDPRGRRSTVLVLCPLPLRDDVARQRPQIPALVRLVPATVINLKRVLGNLVVPSRCGFLHRQAKMFKVAVHLFPIAIPLPKGVAPIIVFHAT